MREFFSIKDFLSEQYDYWNIIYEEKIDYLSVFNKINLNNILILGNIYV